MSDESMHLKDLFPIKNVEHPGSLEYLPEKRTLLQQDNLLFSPSTVMKEEWIDGQGKVWGEGKMGWGWNQGKGQERSKEEEQFEMELMWCWNLISRGKTEEWARSFPGSAHAYLPSCNKGKQLPHYKGKGNDVDMLLQGFFLSFFEKVLAAYNWWEELCG